MFDLRAATMLIQRLIQSIRLIPGAILRLLRAMLLPMVLRGASTIMNFLRLRPNCSASPTSPPMGCEPSRRGATHPTAATSAPASSTALLTPGPHGDSADNSSQSTSTSSAVNASGIPLSMQSATPVTTLNAKPAVPEYFQRFDRRKPVVRTPNKGSISLGTVDYSESTPGMWQRTVHPDGGRYFFDPIKQVFTDTDLIQQQNQVEIEQYINFLREKENRVVPGPPFQEARTQLVIQLDEKDGKREWLYYFVNHRMRVVFWVDELETKNLSAFEDLQGVTEFSHIGYEIEFQYWFHCEQYPNCNFVSQDHVIGFCGILAHACTDCNTSSASLSTLNDSQLARLLSLVPYIQTRVGVIDEYALWVVARVMGIFARARFCNFHGQPGARLEADQSVYAVDEDGDGNTVLFASLDMFLFHTPSSHIRELNDIWVDKTINYARWVDFSNKLNNEWAGFTVYSTVMLAVDVSFLAIPAINGGTGSPSVATVALYMSLLSVVGSLLSSLLLARQRRAQDDSTTGATLFMVNMTQWGGFKALGVMYSLPFALLIWAMIFFVVALSYVIFGSNDLTTWGTAGAGAVLVGSLTLLPILWGRDYSWWSDLTDTFSHYVQVLDLRLINPVSAASRRPSNPHFP